MHGVAPPRMRSLAVAIHLLIANLLGLGAGPLIVGALNDALHAQYGDAAVRYSLLLVRATGVVAAALHAVGARSVAADLAAAASFDRGVFHPDFLLAHPSARKLLNRVGAPADVSGKSKCGEAQ